MKKTILSIVLILLCCNLLAQTSYYKSVYEIQESGCAVMYNGLLWSSRNGLADPLDPYGFYMAHASDCVLPHLRGTFEGLCTSRDNTLDPMTHHQFFRSNIPSGWRLPTKDEFLQLLKSAKSIITYTEPGLGDACFHICDVPINHKFKLYQFNIPMKATFGSMGPLRTYGVKGSYLVQEGVITFEHSRAGDFRGYSSLTLLEGGDLINFAISEYAEFEATYDKAGYVRLVRDL